jgi:hypothetical protein
LRLAPDATRAPLERLTIQRVLDSLPACLGIFRNNFAAPKTTAMKGSRDTSRSHTSKGIKKQLVRIRKCEDRTLD